MMNDNNKNRSGGMYRGVKVPIKALDFIIAIGILALAVIIVISVLI